MVRLLRFYKVLRSRSIDARVTFRVFVISGFSGFAFLAFLAFLDNVSCLKLWLAVDYSSVLLFYCCHVSCLVVH